MPRRTTFRWMALSAALVGNSAVLFALARPITDYVATLAGQEGRKVHGTATVTPTKDGTGTEVAVTLTDDTPGATRPWHIHSGSCVKSGGVVGGGRVYTPIAINDKGQGAGKATVPVVLADTATYYVNIHDAAAAMGIVVACGDLTQK
ncbi:hypothetical protein [Gemmatimonas sp.]|uniref:hypothetical protein n=1 Tax=Gemmatimonas sp. TaxID=1962908 RepID=UPI0039839ED7